MPVSPDPGGVGDPHMTALDGTPFDFAGRPHMLHRLYTRGPIKLLGRLTPIGWTPEDGDPEDATKQYFSGIDVVIGDARVVILNDGFVHVVLPDQHFAIEIKADTIDAPGHPGSTSDEPHPLQGIPHLNLTMPRVPPSRLGESGILVDGPIAALTPELYVVAG